MSDVMFMITLFGPIVALVYAILLLDWLDRRRERRAQKPRDA